MCLIDFTQVQLEPRPSGFDWAAKSALSGLLALTLLLATAFSSSHTLHQSLHSDGAGSHHFCLVCSLIKGQVGAAEVALVFAVLVLLVVLGVRPEHVASVPGPDYRLSHSRAPPAH